MGLRPKPRQRDIVPLETHFNFYQPLMGLVKVAAGVQRDSIPLAGGVGDGVPHCPSLKGTLYTGFAYDF